MFQGQIKRIIKNNLFTLMLVTLVISLLVIFVILFNAIHQANYQNIFKQHRSVNELLFKHKNNGSINPVDVNYIDSWMTFKYINTVFNLPDSYLKNSFNISNNKYPNISLSKYSSAIKVNRSYFVTEVKQAVSSYLVVSTK